MLHLIKLCLKSISSHSESFWGKEFSHFSPILAIQKFFTSVLTFWGGQNFFFAKVPQKGSSFYKKYIVFFVTLGGGGGGSDPM